MTLFKKLWVACTSFILIVFLTFSSSALDLVNAEIPETDTGDTQTYGMSTDKFDVDMNVNENNTFNITESITVNFTSGEHHGIYRNIPYIGTIYREVDGKKISKRYRMKISDIAVKGYNYEAYTEDNNYIIKIGDADSIVTGRQTYVISYNCTLNNDGIDSQDMVYWNFIPYYWETGIESASFKLTMPKEIDKSKAEILCGNYGSAFNQNFKVNIEGNTLKATSTGELEYRQGATVNLVLPDGYFTNEHSDNWIWVAISVVMIASFAVLFLLWFFVGRDKKVIPVVNFYPPENMTSAELGYIIDGKVDDRDLVSLIIYWADKGYLRIQEIGKKDFRLQKIKNLPEDAKKFEKTMFNGLFQDSNEVSSNGLNEKFYTTFEASKSMLNNYFVSGTKNNLYTKKSVAARIFSHILMLVPMAAVLFGGLYIVVAPTYANILAALPMILLFISSLAAAFNFDKKNAMSKASYTLVMIVTTIISAISLVAMCAVGIVYFDKYLMIIAAAIFTAIGYILMLRMKTLTDKGVKWRGDVIGFREFISTAELDRVKALVDENPEYFYNILPYAYALGLTDKWSKKFESIAIEPPRWYTGYYGNSMFNTMLFMHSFNHCMGRMNTDMRSRPQPQGTSSGGFGGGGFSGGGGFGGGGFGGGGGGSW